MGDWGQAVRRSVFCWRVWQGSGFNRLKMFSHLICCIMNFHTLCICNMVSRNNVAVNFISVQHKRPIPITFRSSYCTTANQKEPLASCFMEGFKFCVTVFLHLWKKCGWVKSYFALWWLFWHSFLLCTTLDTFLGIEYSSCFPLTRWGSHRLVVLWSESILTQNQRVYGTLLAEHMSVTCKKLGVPRFLMLV
jgi:hypothetical protein